MDRMIHTALNTLNNLYMNRAVKSQNLSNLNVPGFRRDMGTTFSSGFLTEDKRFDARIFALHEGANVFSANPGNLSETGLETDVAIRGGGFFIIKPDTGGPALSRRGDFEVSNLGELTDGAGSKILDNNLNDREGRKEDGENKEIEILEEEILKKLKSKNDTSSLNSTRTSKSISRKEIPDSKVGVKDELECSDVGGGGFFNQFFDYFD